MSLTDINFLEVYVYGDKPWSEETVVRRFGEAVPLPTGEHAT